MPEAEREKKKGEHNLLEALFWGADPLYWSHASLFCSGVHGLSQIKSKRCEHTLNGHRPLSKATVSGIVVGVERRVNKTVFSVDDGTDVVQCIEFLTGLDKVWMQRRIHVAPSIELGTIVHVQGTLRLDYQFLELEEASTGTDAVRWRVIYVETITPIRDPNEELMLWVQTVQLHETVYCKPAPEGLGQAWQQQNQECFTQGKSQPLKDAVEKYVVEWMTKNQQFQASNVESSLFRITDLLKEKRALLELATQLGSSYQQVSAFIPLVLKDLVAKSVVFQLQEGQFGLMSHVFRPAVLVRLAKYDEERGISVDMLLASLQQDVRCKTMTRDQLVETLQDLLVDGVLYCPGKGRYRIIRN